MFWTFPSEVKWAQHRVIMSTRYWYSGSSYDQLGLQLLSYCFD